MSKNDKILKYEVFLNEVLKEDLRKIVVQHNKTSEQLAEYNQLQTVIQKIQESECLQKSLKTRVDIGCNFYMQAKVNNTEFIFVNVGYGFYVEFTLIEAQEFIKKKTTQLMSFLVKLSQDSAQIKTRIKLVTEGLRELQNIPVK